MATNMILGDVVLFEADESCISRLICALSGSTVSHAAMYYDDVEKLIVEEAMPGIQLSPAPGGPTQERRVHLRRYKGDIDRSKLIAAAKDHLDKHEPYSMSNLVLIGVLLIFERFIKEKSYSRAVTIFFKIVCSLLANAINEKKHPGKLPMTCSQLVSQCYTEAGYSLRFDNKLLSGRAVDNGEPSLADMVVEQLPELGLKGLAASDMTTWADVTPNDMSFLEEILEPNNEELPSSLLKGKSASSGAVLEKLCCFILGRLQGEKQALWQAAEPSPELLEATAYFSASVMQLEEPDAHVANSLSSKDNTIQNILKLRNIFVSPGDLLDHCISLADAGTIDPLKANG